MIPAVTGWTPGGTFDIENRGVAPDIGVELEPESTRDGRDPQLEKAVEVVNQELKRNPPTRLKRPPYPVYR